MTESCITEEINVLLKEKYLLHHIKKEFSEIEDGLLVYIYSRLLTVYDDVSKFSSSPEEQFYFEPSSENLKHILRCLRPLGLTYLATKPKDLLDKKKASRIIFALHDRVLSKYDKSLSQRVRMVIKKEQLVSKTNHPRRAKTMNEDLNLAENTVSENAEMLPEATSLETDDKVFACPFAPVQRKIPGGWQIPRTPLKENTCTGAATFVPPPPPAFEDSPKAKENHLENASSYVLTPPSDFCDKTLINSSSDSASCDTSMEQQNVRGSYDVSNRLNLSDEFSDESSDKICSSESLPPKTNSRLTYCVNKSPESSVPASHRRTYCINKSPVKPAPASRNRRTFCITKINEDFSTKDINDKRNQIETPEINTNRTYAVPKAFADSEDETYIEKCDLNFDVLEEDEDLNFISDEKESFIFAENKDKRRTYVLPKSLVDNLSHSVENESIIHKTINSSSKEVISPALVKPLFVDILKSDISFVECGKGVIPNGRELTRTPPPLNGSVMDLDSSYREISRYDKRKSSLKYSPRLPSILDKELGSNDSNDISKAEKGGVHDFRNINTEIEEEGEKSSVNQSLVSDVSNRSINAINQAISLDSENQSPLTDATFVVSSRSDSVTFDDSMSIFPSKKKDIAKTIVNKVPPEQENTGGFKQPDKHPSILDVDIEEREKRLETESLKSPPPKSKSRKRKTKINDEDKGSVDTSKTQSKFTKKKLIKYKLEEIEEEQSTKEDIKKTTFQSQHLEEELQDVKEDDCKQIKEIVKKIKRGVKATENVKDVPIIESEKLEENSKPEEMKPEASNIKSKHGNKLLKKETKIPVVKSGVRKKGEMFSENPMPVAELIEEDNKSVSVDKEEKKEIITKKRTTRTAVKLTMEKKNLIEISNNEQENNKSESVVNEVKNLQESIPEKERRTLSKKYGKKTAVVENDVASVVDENKPEEEIETVKPKTKRRVENVKSHKKDNKLNLNTDEILKMESKQNGKSQIEGKNDVNLEEEVKYNTETLVPISVEEKQTPEGDQTEFKKPEPRRTQRIVRSKLNYFEDNREAIPEVKSRSNSMKRTKSKQRIPSEEENKEEIENSKVRTNSITRKKKEMTKDNPTVSVNNGKEEKVLEKTLKQTNMNEKEMKKDEYVEKMSDEKSIEIEEKETITKKNVPSRKRVLYSRVSHLINKFNTAGKENSTELNGNGLGKENVFEGKRQNKRLTKKNILQENESLEKKESPLAPAPLLEYCARPSRRCKVNAKNAISEMLSETE